MICNKYIKLLLLAWGIPVFSETVNFWKIPEKPPIFYQEPSISSKSLPVLQANQVMIFLQSQKEWVKLIDPRTGTCGWIAKKDKATPVASIELNVSGQPDSYQYSVKMQSPNDVSYNYWSTSGASFYQGAKKKGKDHHAHLSQLEKAFWQDMQKERKSMEKFFENSWVFNKQGGPICKVCQNKKVVVKNQTSKK